MQVTYAAQVEGCKAPAPKFIEIRHTEDILALWDKHFDSIVDIVTDDTSYGDIRITSYEAGHHLFLRWQPMAVPTGWVKDTAKDLQKAFMVVEKMALVDPRLFTDEGFKL